MPPPSKIDQLPPEVRAALDQFLIAAGFGNIVQAAEWLTELGHPIGKSSVGAYNQKLKQRIAAIKASTEAAKLIVAAAPDEAADRSNAIIALVQHDIFESLLSLQQAASDETDPLERVELLGKAAKHIATLARADIARQKHAQEVRETARQELLREQEQKLDAAVQSRGMTADQAAFWREQFLKGT
jgi:vacuolar-type H+-ATPase catalytic subunit A/Vma1